MTDDILRMAREAECGHESMTLNWIPPDGLERFAALVRADEREKHQENNLMAECMDMVRDDLIRAGIISEEVPPMMLPEAIKRALKERVEAEREKCAPEAEHMARLASSSRSQSAGGANG